MKTTCTAAFVIPSPQNMNIIEMHCQILNQSEKIVCILLEENMETRQIPADLSSANQLSDHNSTHSTLSVVHLMYTPVCVPLNLILFIVR